MYIKDIFNQKKVVISLEIFPPKKNVPIENVTNAAKVLSGSNPDFMSVTYGAGGSATDNTLNIASYLQNELDTTALAHLTCIGSKKHQIIEFLGKLKQHNIHNHIVSYHEQ